MSAQEEPRSLGGEGRDREIRSAAHDLNNLVYRLTLLSESLAQATGGPAGRSEAGEMLADTTRRLAGIVDRLRRLTGGEA
jgi:hypothetical protein